MAIIIFLSIITGIIPVIIFTIKYGITAFPGFLNQGYDYLYTRIWFRINPFLFGIVLALVKYEYKYGTLYKAKLRQFINNSYSFFQKALCYVLGMVLMLFPIFILLTDTMCIERK